MKKRVSKYGRLTVHKFSLQSSIYCKTRFQGTVLYSRYTIPPISFYYFLKWLKSVFVFFESFNSEYVLFFYFSFIFLTLAHVQKKQKAFIVCSNPIWPVEGYENSQ
jgi:hypothetical protein